MVPAKNTENRKPTNVELSKMAPLFRRKIMHLGGLEMSALGHHHIPFLTHLQIPVKPVYPGIQVVTKENPYFESEDKILKKTFPNFY